jgi:serine/threonine protein kinase
LSTDGGDKSDKPKTVQLRFPESEDPTSANKALCFLASDIKGLVEQLRHGKFSSFEGNMTPLSGKETTYMYKITDEKGTTICYCKLDNNCMRHEIGFYEYIARIKKNYGIGPTIYVVSPWFIGTYRGAYEPCDVIVFDNSTLSDLFDLVNSDKWNSKWIPAFFKDMCAAVEWLHSIGIGALDLKFENFLVVENPNSPSMPTRPVLSDFDMYSTFLDPKVAVEIVYGSPQYAPPEIFQGKAAIPVKVDYWSLGVMLYVMYQLEFLTLRLKGGLITNPLTGQRSYVSPDITDFDQRTKVLIDQMPGVDKTVPEAVSRMLHLNQCERHIRLPESFKTTNLVNAA